jgi:fused signal recognition particle receptor
LDDSAARDAQVQFRSLKRPVPLSGHFAGVGQSEGRLLSEGGSGEGKEDGGGAGPPEARHTLDLTESDLIALGPARHTLPGMFKRLMERFDRLLGRGVIDDEFYEELEEALLQADTHVQTATAILQELRSQVRDEKITEPEAMKERLRKAIADRFRQDANSRLREGPEAPTVYLFVGVNGVGKTTTIAKLSQRLVGQGRRVLLAAGDTFRAAAIEQLQTWAERTGAEIVRTQPGADPAAVIFDAITSAKARGFDYVLADTAGRQHSKESLMQELGKIARVLERALGRPADEVLLVLDANTGQNAIRQAEEFTKATGVTGLVLTKLDGTARGGALLGVYERFRVPIKMIGVGEKASDLRDFDPVDFARRLFD